MWDTLTSSLCAIVHDNLPLELLNQPFHIAPEVSPLADPGPATAAEGTGTGNGDASSSSPAWMDTARSSSDEVRGEESLARLGGNGRGQEEVQEAQNTNRYFCCVRARWHVRLVLSFSSLPCPTLPFPVLLTCLSCLSCPVLPCPAIPCLPCPPLSS